jgi:hypothetical protein
MMSYWKWCENIRKKKLIIIDSAQQCRAQIGNTIDKKCGGL